IKLNNEKQRIGIVKVDSDANVRSGPGTNYKVIAVLKNKVRVVVTEKSGNWWKIVIPNGKVGFIHNSLLTVDWPADPAPTAN
ncbi:MAG: SH3 domain-containing protein, partial [Candidatus Wallbacteria bacterium]|nr:SH3 domain-containing protein [Candidatus Wallbacteria bacterium]